MSQAPDDAELVRRFTYHPPTADQVPRFGELREAGLAMARLIVELTPASREQALALTKLDEVVMHANAAIARREGEAPLADAVTALPEPDEPHTGKRWNFGDGPVVRVGDDWVPAPCPVDDCPRPWDQQEGRYCGICAKTRETCAEDHCLTCGGPT